MRRKPLHQTIMQTVLVLFWLLSSALGAAGHGDVTHRVLYINSYHPGYRWSDDIEGSIRQRLNASRKKIDLSIEYLDTLRFPEPDQLKRMAAILAAKYSRYRNDLIIVSDNAALEFVIEHRRRLFPTQPVVFCGYNNFRPRVLRGVPNVTGINEEVDVQALVDMALRIHPRTRTLAFILSTRETSNRHNAEKAEASVLPRYQGRYQLVVLKDAPMSRIRGRLGSLPRESLVFQVGWIAETDRGRVLSPQENGRLISAASPVPVYTLWDFCLGSGVLGGHVLTGSDQGRAAAGLALRILGGEAAGGIPVVMTPPTSNMFDYAVMRRFSVPENALPANSVVINRPESPWHRYRLQIAGVVLLVGIETVLVIALFRAMSQRRHALHALELERMELERRVEERTHELHEEQRRLEESLLTRDTLLGNALVTIALLKERRVVWASNHVIEMFGYTPEEVIGHTPEFLYADPESYREIITEAPAALVKGETFRGDYCYRRKDGSNFWCTISGKAIDPADLGKGVLFVMLDIDDRKRMERALQEANTRLGTLATTDPLTGIANRRRVTQVIEGEIIRHNRYAHPFSVILMDVDYFKGLNDQFGHNAGDSVLLQIAGILTQYSRDVDTAARWGGEEFLVVCPETDLENAAKLAELFRKRIAQHDFSLPVRVTASFGVEQYRKGTTPEALVKGADNALYRAKLDSRNCVRLAGTDGAPASLTS